MNATDEAVVILSLAVSRKRLVPSPADCWLLNAIAHLRQQPVRYRASRNWPEPHDPVVQQKGT